VGLNKIEDYVSMGRLSPTGTGSGGVITMKDLIDANIVSSIKHGVKLVASDKVKTSKDISCKYPLNLEVSSVSSQAIASIEAAGGSVVATHFNRLALRALLKPHKFEPGMIPRRARPPPKMMEYYTRYEKRGYLSKEIQLERQLRKLGLEDKK
jgi:large subunit ribosomal protein L15